MAYKRKPYRYKLRYKLLFWSLIAMIIFSIANIFMNRPAKGTIIKPSLQDEPIQETLSKTNSMTAKYFKLKYDADLDTVSNVSADDQSALEVYRVARSDAKGRRKFVVTIKRMPPGGMSEESSYKLRETKLEDYIQSAETFGDLAFVCFTKKDGSEMTAFVADRDKFAMLAYTLDVPNASVRDEAVSLLKNFSWNR